MAVVTIPEAKNTLSATAEINEFLEPFGIVYEQWNAAKPIGEDATNEEILDAYAPEIDRLMARGGYVVADIINVTPETPGLDAMLNKFNKEHTHSEDEVRFIVKGRGVFHVNPAGKGPVFAIEMEPGDLINVPAGYRHWFDLCTDRTIRAIRLFKDPSGWAPHYVDDGVHEHFAPLCWGPEYIAGHGMRVKGIEV